jgi:hypothetical protein
MFKQNQSHLQGYITQLLHNVLNIWRGCCFNVDVVLK